MRSVFTADLTGLVVLGSLVFLLSCLLISDPTSRMVGGFVVFGVLAATALGMWHGKTAKSLTGPKHWLALFGASLLFAGISFAIDMAIGHISHPGIPIFEAGRAVRGPFGFAFTLILCPGLTSVAMAGLVRAIVLGL